ncbi:MAG: hypothetical protein KGZ86_03400 [Candidatus Latescibacteria bacterium]|nr:hypothetical protein [Candidatus Latescibacterota bacterium]
MQKCKHITFYKVFVYLVYVFGFWFLIFNFSFAAPLDNIQTDSWIYDAVDYLKTAGYIQTIPPTSKPWTRKEVIEIIKETDLNQPYPNRQVGFYLFRLLDEFSSEIPNEKSHLKRKPPIKIDYGQGNLHVNPYLNLTHNQLPYWLTPYGNNIFPDNQTAAFGLSFSLDQNSKISLYNHSEVMFFRKQIENSETTGTSMFHVPGTRWMYSFHYISMQSFLRFDSKQAYLAFPISILTLELGRDNIYWGPAYRSSVMLSDIAPSFDHIQLRTGGKKFKAMWFFSALSRLDHFHRFMSGQRFEINIGKNTRLGGSMLSVFSFDSLQTKNFFPYLNPLVPIYFEVDNTGQDDNLLVSFDFTAYIRQVRIYGHLMVDNYEFNTKPNRPPNCYGLTFGAFLPIHQFALRTEYSKITRYTYYHRILHIAYTSYSVPLGHSLGPDADELFLRLECFPRNDMQINLVGTITRRGDGNRGTLADKTWFVDDPRPESFPSGTVIKTILLGPEIFYQPRYNLTVRAGIYYNVDKKLNSFIKLSYQV